MTAQYTELNKIYLGEQGFYAALVHPRDLSPNAAVGCALNSILHQFSGLDTDASDMEASRFFFLFESCMHQDSILTA